MNSSGTSEDAFHFELIERLLDAPGLPLGHERDMARCVTAAVCADLVDHSQQVRLRADDYQLLAGLAEGVLAYDSKSKRLYHSLYLPPPALSSQWIAHLRTWLDDIKWDQEDTNRPGRPTDTWEPYLFALGLGLYAALYDKVPTTTGGTDQKPGPAMRFMIELIAAGRAICEKYARNTDPWNFRENPALKKQIKARLDFEKARPVWSPDPDVPETLYRPNSYVVYGNIYLAQLRREVPFSVRSWDNLKLRR